MNARRAVFLDKDGTLLVDVPYNVDPARMELSTGAGAALRALAAAGHALFVVSNQSGVARGLFDERALAGVEDALSTMLAEEGVVLGGFAWCPHHPAGTAPPYALACDCRKPRPGMLFSLAARYGVDLARSWMVGDILDDIEAGNAAGCRTVLIENGNETQWRLTASRTPRHRVPDLAAAANAILAETTGRLPLAATGATA